MTRHVRAAAGALALLFATSCRGERASPRGDIAVRRVVAAAPVVVGALTAATMAVYATIANSGAAADTLTAIETPAALVASLHTTMDHGGGSMMMMPAGAVAVPAGATVRLAPGGTHVMLEGLARQFAPGDSLPLTLVFRRAGRLSVAARVVAYDQLERALTR